MQFPEYRPRRLRRNENLRRLVRETSLSVDDLIMPLFVRPGKGVRNEIPSMPGNYQMSVDMLVQEVEEVSSLGIPGVILFGIPEKKDPEGRSGYGEDSIIVKSIQAIKEAVPEILVVTDVCLCEYTDHGHCGVVTGGGPGKPFEVDNDATLKILSEMSLSFAEAGADIIAPSDMMDGRVGAIRQTLDDNGLQNVPIMAYAAKFASAFYGPFRDAAESPPQFGDRRSYQMDSANVEEALREVALDIEEGADIVMVKPALAYMDVIQLVKERFGYPVAAYSVSGEFAMVKAAAERGWLEERRIVLEILVSLKRAGASIVLTYWAKDVARWLSLGEGAS